MANHLESTTPREQLAAYRTDLANERTGLAYVRTALTLFVVGITFLKFFSDPVLIVSGIIFIPASIALFIFGLDRYRRMRKMISRIRRAHHISSR
ncbi:MAG: DUF202 domain-containing protein [bacterium]|nr:DUF202 domain-containing protein [bacterium]